jgi:hypothetical protein
VTAAGIEGALTRIRRYVLLRRVIERAQELVAHRGEGYATLRLMSALRRSRRTLDKEDVDGFLLLEAVALDLAQRGRLRRARVVNSWAAEGLLRVLGPRAPATVRAVHRHSQLLWRTGDPEAGLRVAEEVAAAGGDEAQAAAAMAGLGIILADLGRLDEARPYQERALAGRIAALGEEHPATLQSLTDLFMTQVEAGDAESAADLLPRIVDARIATFQKRDDLSDLDVGRALEANVTDYNMHEQLVRMLNTGAVPSRREFKRVEIFDM